MADPEKVFEPDEDGFLFLDESDVTTDNTWRPMRESLRKMLKPPYNGQPFPPEVQAAINAAKAAGPAGPEDEIVILEETDVETDNTVRPMRESLRKMLKPPYNGQPLPSAPPPQEPPPDKPLS